VEQMLKDKGLKTLIALLKDKTPTVKVGVLGGKNLRKDGVETNAQIGLKHEFGKEGMPVRSFLRMPLIEKLNKTLQKSNALDIKTIKKVIEEKSFFNFIQKIGIVSVAIIDDAFHTGGFGKWKPSKMEYKTNHQTLVETQQLRESIDYEVKK
jgi:hypothetical protein